MKLKKWEGNPVLKPTGKGYWEKMAVLNPGAYYDNGKVYMLYRASGEIEDYRIYFGLATSVDGFHFKRESGQPVFSPEVKDLDAGCVEDARIVKYGEYYYVTYACRALPPEMFWKGRAPKYPDSAPRVLRENLTRTALARTKDFRNYERLGAITNDDVDDRDAIIFPEKVNGKYVMFHRPAEWVGAKYGTEKPGMWLAWSDDMLHWKDDYLLAVPKFEWEFKKIGGGTPPIKTEKGWLVIYHGVDADHIYRSGAMMLDINDPKRIIARCPDFILEPEADFETKGVMKNVVFPTGNVVIDGTLFVYYGGADTVCCVATANLNEFVDHIMKYKK
ncbi:MAG: glycosidase [Elusimicrobiota bacterium]